MNAAAAQPCAGWRRGLLAPLCALLGLAIHTAALAQSSSDRGSALYGQYCLACHGADGGGMTPGVPDLSDAAGVLRKSDADLLRSLTEGVQRPGATLPMPPKGGNPALTSADMQAVLAYLRSEFGPPGPASRKGR